MFLLHYLNNSVGIIKAQLLRSVFEESTLEHWKHFSFFSLKWLIEIVFTKQAPSNKYIHPLLASIHTSYTGFSTFLNLTDAQLHSDMPVQRRIKNNTVLQCGLSLPHSPAVSPLINVAYSHWKTPFC